MFSSSISLVPNHVLTLSIKNWIGPNYAFRPGVKCMPPGSYMPKDLDLTKPRMRRQLKRNKFEVTTVDVLKEADFRNVRFLGNFITDAGIIIRRSQTKISAKAQRKVAREIKTARVLGLIPFTTMGTKEWKLMGSS